MLNSNNAAISRLNCITRVKVTPDHDVAAAACRYAAQVRQHSATERNFRCLLPSVSLIGMVKGTFIALVVLLVLSQFDQHFYHGKHTDAALSILRHMRHSFG